MLVWRQGSREGMDFTRRRRSQNDQSSRSISDRVGRRANERRLKTLVPANARLVLLYLQTRIRVSKILERERAETLQLRSLAMLSLKSTPLHPQRVRTLLSLRARSLAMKGRTANLA